MAPPPLDTSGSVQADDSAGHQLLMPVSPSATLQDAVTTVTDAALDAADSGPVTLVFAAVEPMRPDEGGASGRVDRDVLDQAAAWARAAAGEQADLLDIQTTVLGEDVFVFHPADVAAVLHDAAADRGIERIVLDPEYDPGVDMPLIQPLETELQRYSDIACSVADVSRSRTPHRLPAAGGVPSAAATFTASFLLYIILAGHVTLETAVTGGITGLVAAATMARLLFTGRPGRTTAARLLRLAIYLPFLLAAVVKANLQIARRILHPSLPINPAMVRVTPPFTGSIPLTVLGNSTTLTPGTLTVTVEGNELLVHTLDRASRQDLLDGGLVRWTQYVMDGTPRREAASGTATVLDGGDDR